MTDILDISTAYWRSAALFAALRLNLFEILKEASLTAVEAAGAAGAEADLTGRLLRAMAAMGLVMREGGKFRLPEGAADRMTAGGNRDASGFCRLMSEDFSAGIWGALPEVVKGGDSASGIVDETLASAEMFTRAMHSMSLQEEAEALCRGLDLSGAGRLVDFGGGSGAYSIALCRAYTETLSAVIVERPEVVPVTQRFVREAGLEGRIEAAAGDWHSMGYCGEFDASLLSDVLYQSEEECRKLVGTACASLKQGGIIAVRGYFLDDDDGRVFPALFDINLLVHSPEERTYEVKEVAGWLSQAGLTGIEVAPLTERSYLITGLKG